MHFMVRLVAAACFTFAGGLMLLLNIYWWINQSRTANNGARSPSVGLLVAPILGGCGALLASNRWFTVAGVVILLADPASWILILYAFRRKS